MNAFAAGAAGDHGAAARVAAPHSSSGEAPDTRAPQGALVVVHHRPGECTIELADPARRNALGSAMFAALAHALGEAERATAGGAGTASSAGIGTGAGTAGGAGIGVGAAEPGGGGGGDAAAMPREAARVVRLCAQGPAFCGGFDLAACVERPALLRDFVHQLSAVVRSLRALPVPVVAQVQGAALAGGCALLAGCDLVVVAPDAQLGYPVHRIGVSPAVTLPALLASAGAGRAREITMGGAVYTGASAVRMGLATHCAPSAAELAATTDAVCESLARKGPQALRATKAWLNELDGTRTGARFEHAAAASAAAADGDEFAQLLRAFWASRSA